MELILTMYYYKFRKLLNGKEREHISCNVDDGEKYETAIEWPDGVAVDTIRRNALATLVEEEGIDEATEEEWWNYYDEVFMGNEILDPRI